MHSETRQLAQMEKTHQAYSSSVRSDQWDNELLYIPPLPPTNLRGCHLISIQYSVYVSPIQSPNHLRHSPIFEPFFFTYVCIIYLFYDTYVFKLQSTSLAFEIIIIINVCICKAKVIQVLHASKKMN